MWRHGSTFRRRHWSPTATTRPSSTPPSSSPWKDAPQGKLILVTAINPTKAGEGKTTTTIGLGDGLSRIGKKTAIALREPSLGPCFGQKGGATGGGQAQVDADGRDQPAFHRRLPRHHHGAQSAGGDARQPYLLGQRARHRRPPRLLAARPRHERPRPARYGGQPGRRRQRLSAPDPLRYHHGLGSHGHPVPRRATSAISSGGWDASSWPKPATAAVVTADDLKAAGAMAAVLKDAVKPNLVQTLENNPVLIHGGPFANIAHGCNSVIATKTALALADYVVTEAGFGADLGAEKFLDIKCRQAGLKPDLAVVVATVRALKLHGGAAEKSLGHGGCGRGRARAAEPAASRREPRQVWIAGAGRHQPLPERLAGRAEDDREEMRHRRIAARSCATTGRVAAPAAEDMARAAVETIAKGRAAFKPLYADELPLVQKIETIAREIYRAADVAIAGPAQRRLKVLEEAGFGRLPVCIAKTQYSFSADPELRGAPTGHTLPIREVRLSAGAGFVVAMAGEIMTMPGLPRVPAAEAIGLTAEGEVDGIF